MMGTLELLLQREPSEGDHTHGTLYVDGVKECYTLEDIVRPDGLKVHGETAIPAGKYVIELTYSPRFQKILPLILDVRNFSGVRIHPGNTARDTEGCILVGQARYGAGITRSRAAFNLLFDKLADARKHGQRITLTIAPAMPVN